MLSSFSSCEITTRFLSVGKHVCLEQIGAFTYFIETGLREAKNKIYALSSNEKGG